MTENSAVKGLISFLTLVNLVVVSILLFMYHGNETITSITIAEIVVTYWISLVIALLIVGIMIFVIIMIIW